MWKYLKYFVPIISAIIILVFAGFYGINYGKNSELSKQAVWIFLVCFLFFSISWYLFTSKPEHKFSYLIIFLFFLLICPSLILSVSTNEQSFLKKILIDEGGNLGYMCLISLLLAFVYSLRFYFKTVQDVYSILKLLLVLTTVILSIVFFLELIEDIRIKSYLGITIFSLLLLSTVIHIVDMIHWERNKEKEINSQDSLNSLIDQISGNNS